MSGYEGVCICYVAYVCSARWLFFGYFPANVVEPPQDKGRRIYLLRAWMRVGRMRRASLDGNMPGQATGSAGKE
jgi:hypothetical protein